MNEKIDITIGEISKPQIELSLMGPRGPKGDKGDNAKINPLNLASGSAFINLEDTTKTYALSAYGVSDPMITGYIDGEYIVSSEQHNLIQCPEQVSKFTLQGSYTGAVYTSDGFKAVLYLVKENEGLYSEVGQNIEDLESSYAYALQAQQNVEGYATAYTQNISNANAAIAELGVAQTTIASLTSSIEATEYIINFNAANDLINDIVSLVGVYETQTPSFTFDILSPYLILEELPGAISDVEDLNSASSTLITNNTNTISSNEVLIQDKALELLLLNNTQVDLLLLPDAYTNAWYSILGESWYTDLDSKVTDFNNSAEMSAYQESVGDPVIDTAAKRADLVVYIQNNFELHSIIEINTLASNALADALPLDETQFSFTTGEFIDALGEANISMDWMTRSAEYTAAEQNFNQISAINTNIASNIVSIATLQSTIASLNSTNAGLVSDNDAETITLSNNTLLISQYNGILTDLENMYSAMLYNIDVFDQQYGLGIGGSVNTFISYVPPNTSVDMGAFDLDVEALYDLQQDTQDLLNWNGNIYDSIDNAISGINVYLTQYLSEQANLPAAQAFMQDAVDAALENLNQALGNINSYELFKVGEFEFSPNSPMHSPGMVNSTIELDYDLLGLNPLYTTKGSRFLLGWEGTLITQYKVSYSLTAKN